MRSLTAFFVLLVGLMAPGSLAHAQGTEPVSKTGGSAAVGATKEEVNQLRSEVAAQRQTIEDLKAMVQELVASRTQVSDAGLVESGSPAVEGARLLNATLVQPGVPAELMIEQAQPAAAPKKEGPPLTAGWSGEHFFIKSPDGQFSISPYGYVNTDYRANKGDGAPPDTFLVRRARFGFQGNYGSHFDFAILTDAAATSGAVVRDVYLNVRIKPEFQFQAGQFKQPFAQETGIGATNLDFVERGLQSLLYPSSASAYRSPGIAFHGDISKGAIQWWAGAFNGRGGVTSNTTNEPDFVGRLRFYPFRNHKNDRLKQFAFGGSIDHAVSRGLSNDVSFSATIPDAAYTFFPQLRINGPIWRYEGEFTYLLGPYALRGEYVQMQQQRYAVGSETPGGLGFFTIPGVGAKAWNISTTYLLTKEKRPENGTPRVKAPLYGPDTPGGKGRGLGAWELALRYSGIQAKAPGANFFVPPTPGLVPTYDFHTDEITFGVNWYPNYWVKYMVNVSVDQLHQPSVIGQEPQNFFVVLQRLQFRF